MPAKDPITGKFISPDQSAAQHQASEHQARLAELSDAFDIVDPGQQAIPPAAPSAPATNSVASPVPPAPKLSSHVLRRAKALGFDEADLEGMEPDVIEDRLFYRQQDQQRYYEKMGLSRPESTTPSATGTAPVAPVAPAPAAPPAPASFKDKLLAKYGDQLDSKYLDALEGAINDVIAERMKPFAEFPERLKGIEETSKYLSAAEQQRANLSFSQKVDEWFNKNPDIFGTGTFESLDKNSREYQLRQMFAMKVTNANEYIKQLEDHKRLLYGDRPAAPTPPAPARPAVGAAPSTPRNGDAAHILAEREKQWKDGQLGAPSRQHAMEEVGTKSAAVAEIDRILTDAKRRDGGPNVRQQEEDSLIP